MARPDGRASDELRPVTLTRDWSMHPEGSVLVEFGQTRVLCTASVTEGVPRWRKGSGLGWVTAEYAMLPRATTTRSDRESVKGRIGGEPRLDLCYEEDVVADVDMNIVCTGTGDFVEVQGTGEQAVFHRRELDTLVDLGAAGCAQLAVAQQAALRA